MTYIEEGRGDKQRKGATDRASRAERGRDEKGMKNRERSK